MSNKMCRVKVDLGKHRGNVIDLRNFKDSLTLTLSQRERGLHG